MANDRLLGRVVGRYRVESVIGRGGMGVVYRARDERLDRVVALKVLSDERATDAGFRERFLRESRLLASIDHPNIVPVFEADEADGELYIAMRFVQGPELGRIIERDGPMAPSRAVAIIAQVADALDAAHATGLVHRDIKPANILVVSGPSSDHAYLTDFGLTKMAGASTGLTQAGQFVGTPGYVSPEQIQGRGVDHRSDVYALGCVLYDCLTGAVPYPRDSTMASLWAHVHEIPPRPSEVRPGLPLTFDAVIAKALAKGPDERFQTAGGLAAAARKAIPVSAAAATTITDTPVELLPAPVLGSANAEVPTSGEDTATTMAAAAAASTLPPEAAAAQPMTVASVDPAGTVVGVAAAPTVVAGGAPPTVAGAPPTVAGGTPPPNEPRATVVAGGDRPRWRTTPFVGLSAALIGILAVSGLAVGSGMIDLTGNSGNPDPTGTHGAVVSLPPAGGGTPEPAASVDPSLVASAEVSTSPGASSAGSPDPLATPVPDPVTPRPATPRPATPRPATPRPATPKPATPKPATPKPATPRPATPTPGPVNKAPFAVADPITFASATSHSHYDLALMDNDTDSDGINDTIFYHDNTQPSYGTITGWVECQYNGRTQYCLRYDPSYSGPFTDYFYYRIEDDPGGLVSDWALVTVKFNS